MKIVIITHPTYSPFFSIKLYTNMLVTNCLKYGYQVETWQAENYFNKPRVGKLLNYFYQFILFPREIRKKLKFKDANDKLYVFADQSLGYLVPIFKNYRHVVHCHDFLSQKSALEEIAENKVSTTGKIYQALIRRGFNKGRNFISISKATKNDLHRFLKDDPDISKVVYNGLNLDFNPVYKNDTYFDKLRNEFLNSATTSYILHVGGEHFYKNREGVLRLYLQLKKKYKIEDDLVMVGPQSDKLVDLLKDSKYQSQVHIISGVSDEQLKQLYSNAKFLLFPSLEEGFGWPIAEAMASGCPVVTTGKAPMTEVGSNAALYIPRLSASDSKDFQYNQWIEESASKIFKKLYNVNSRSDMVCAGLKNAKRFESNKSFEKIDKIYRKVYNI